MAEMRQAGNVSEVLAALGDRVAAAREQARLTQVALARRLGVTDAYVSLIERGKRNPPITLVFAIAEALGVPPGRLV